MKRRYLFLLFISFNSLFAQVPGYTAIVNSGSPGGYYFTAPINFSGLHSSYQIILDSSGSVVYYKNFSSAYTYDFKIQLNGLISYFNASQGKFFLMNSAFTIVDTIAAQNGLTTDVHELQILPNGHFLILAQETVTMDLSSYLFFNNNGSPGSSTATVTCSVIQELDENKNVVFEWHAKDHFSFDSSDDFFLSNPSTVDWIHSNALELDNDGNILMSSRHFDEITKINRQDGSIIWRLGGKYNQFTFIGDTVPFYGQHDIRRLSNGDISFFDDGNHFTPHGSRAVEYRLDEINKTAQLVWSHTYDSTMYSTALGSVQRLYKSNTLIDYGDFHSNNVCFNVVDSTGAELFRLFFTNGLYSYRSFNYPQLPWNLNRPEISCFRSGDTLYLDAGSGHSSYLWSNGKTTRTIAVTSSGSFYVFVPYGQNGFISSQKATITDLNSACTTSNVSESLPEKAIKIFPNPAHQQINIYCNSLNYHISPFIKDLSGRIISIPLIARDLDDYTFTYDVSSLADGFYILTMNGESFKFIKN